MSVRYDLNVNNFKKYGNCLYGMKIKRNVQTRDEENILLNNHYTI